MRSNLGRLDSLTEILQVGPPLVGGGYECCNRSAWSCCLRDGISSAHTGSTHENFPSRGCDYFAGLTCLCAGTSSQFAAGQQACEVAGGKRRRVGAGQGLQGVAQENPGREGAGRSLGQCAWPGFAQNF